MCNDIICRHPRSCINPLLPSIGLNLSVYAGGKVEYTECSHGRLLHIHAELDKDGKLIGAKGKSLGSICSSQCRCPYRNDANKCVNRKDHIFADSDSAAGSDNNS